MKKIIIYSILILFLSCATNIDSFNREPFVIDEVTDDVNYIKIIGLLNSKMNVFYTRLDSKINNYNKLVNGNNGWYITEAIITGLGALTSGGLALTELDNKYVIIPISVSSLLSTFSIGIRQITLSEKLANESNEITALKIKILRFEGLIVDLRYKYETNESERENIMKSFDRLYSEIVMSLNV